MTLSEAKESNFFSSSSFFILLLVIWNICMHYISKLQLFSIWHICSFNLHHQRIHSAIGLNINAVFIYEKLNLHTSYMVDGLWFSTIFNGHQHDSGCHLVKRISFMVTIFGSYNSYNTNALIVWDSIEYVCMYVCYDGAKIVKEKCVITHWPIKTKRINCCCCRHRRVEIAAHVVYIFIKHSLRWPCGNCFRHTTQIINSAGMLLFAHVCC